MAGAYQLTMGLDKETNTALLFIKITTLEQMLDEVDEDEYEDGELTIRLPVESLLKLVGGMNFN